MKLEIGKAYLVSNAYKKSLLEIEIFMRDSEVEGEPPQQINLHIWWRGGSYVVRPQNEDEIEMLESSMVDPDSDEYYKDGDEICISDFEDWELDSTHDGQSEELEFLRVPEDEQATIQEGYDEDTTSFLEEQGFYTDDLEVYIQNGIIIEDAPEYYNRED